MLFLEEKAAASARAAPKGTQKEGQEPRLLCCAVEGGMGASEAAGMDPSCLPALTQHGRGPGTGGDPAQGVTQRGGSHHMPLHVTGLVSEISVAALRGTGAELQGLFFRAVTELHGVT